MTIDKQYEKKLIEQQIALQKKMLSVLNKSVGDISAYLSRYSKKFPDDYAKRITYINRFNIKRQLMAQMKETARNLEVLSKKGVNEAWALSVQKNNLITKQFVTGINIPTGLAKAMFGNNERALLSYFKNKSTISKNVLEYTGLMQEQVEEYMASGIIQGKGAREIATDLKRIAENPQATFKAMQKANPDKKVKFPVSKSGRPGVYRSVVRNLRRIARTETNMAFRYSDGAKRQTMPFVVGVKVNLSGAHPQYDICDSMAGSYPKAYVFGGWHPHCYSDDTEVYTKEGWKLFKDVKDDDLILSLNPDNKDIEWSGIVRRFKYHREQEMIRFYNRSLDLMVTPEHKMIYINKSDSIRIMDNKIAANYSMTIGGLYRGCEYIQEEKTEIQIGEHLFDFNLFAEFLGYYLSEGSFSRKYCVTISQDERINPDKYLKMKECLINLGYKVSCSKIGLSIFDKSLWEYVSKFRKSAEKYIPDEIKNSGINNIKSFLKAFNIGDGTIRQPKNYIGSRGGGGNFKEEITHATSSVKMADDLGELILKSGKRPSFHVAKTKGTIIKFRNGNYKINNDQITIRECKSKTATVFKKEIIEYNGFVYDIELDKNHILWVRRNGKTVWGSNCLCYTTTIMATKDEFKDWMKTGMKGTVRSNNYVPRIPITAERYVKTYKDKLKGSYFYRDNFTKDGKPMQFIGGERPDIQPFKVSKKDGIYKPKENILRVAKDRLK